MPEFIDEDGLYDAESVTLTDEDGRSLLCYVENSLDREGENVTYLLLRPLDSPVIIVTFDENSSENEDFSEVITIEESMEITKIFADAKAVLAELELSLHNTAFTLTVSGELPPLEEDEIVNLELDEENSQLESEELQFLANFYHDDRQYKIYTPLSPLLFLASCDDRGELKLISPEDRQMKPILEELLFEELE
ncbi:MAG: DUF3727 domain-containing protein [Prochloraceae cyanobacterium]